METEIANPLAIVLVSIDGNRVNGYLYALNLGDNVDILSIFVDNMYRLRHIGTNLIEYLKSMVNGSITLEVAEDNSSALKLYNKVGFKVVGTRKKYYINADAYVMKLESGKWKI